MTQYYRRRLLEIVDSFLENTPAALTHAHASVQRWLAEKDEEARALKLDDILWGNVIVALTDSVFYENNDYLQDIRELLLGHVSRTRITAVSMEDYRPYFTSDELAWYNHLLSMIDFLSTIPFAVLHEAIYPAIQSKERWETMLARIPEASQIENIDKEYEQSKVHLEELAASCPAPVALGDESIYHLILREVTAILIEIWVGRTAVYLGYPILWGSYSVCLDIGENEYPDMTENIMWAKRMLEALKGGSKLYFSWRFYETSAVQPETLFIRLQ